MRMKNGLLIGLHNIGIVIDVLLKLYVVEVFYCLVICLFCFVLFCRGRECFETQCLVFVVRALVV